MNNNENIDALKYETNNPISRLLVKNFFTNLDTILSTIQFKDVYEAGCGNGYVTEYIMQQYPNSNITAIDIDRKKIEIAKNRVEGVIFTVGSIYETGQPSSSFDLVVSTEVLEHLDNPIDALNELLRISKKYVIISTPNEPLWKMANMARFKYLLDFGNTPGHIQHWSKKSLLQFAGNVCDVRVIRSPFPWVMFLCEKRKIGSE